MTLLRIAALTTFLVTAVAGLPAAEPAGVKGYIAWTDPATSKKHLVMGVETRTGATVFAEEFPVITIHFRGSGPGSATSKRDPKDMVKMTSPSVWAPVDASGRVLPTGRANWVGANVPVAFRYSVAFLQDPGWRGDPVALDDTRTIKYNPTRNQFLEVVVELPFEEPAGRPGGGQANQGYLTRTGARVPAEDFIDKPPAYKPRKTPFTDLPNF
jgi:hypothetical protein